MATATQPAEIQSVNDYIRVNKGKVDDGKLLELAIAETERTRAEAKFNENEWRVLSEVKFGPDGLVPENMNGLWRMAKLFAASEIVPKHFQGKQEDCFIALQLAMRCKIDPFAFLSHCYIVGSKAAIEAQLAIAMLNKSGIIKGRLRRTYSGEGDSRMCVVSATLADTGENIEQEISVALAKDAGWWSRNPLWAKMTDLFLGYRASLWLIRAYAPEVLMGLYSKDELDDIDGPDTPKLIITRKGYEKLRRDSLPGDDGSDEQVNGGPAVGSATNGHAEPKPEAKAELKQESAAEETDEAPAWNHTRILEQFAKCKTIEDAKLAGDLIIREAPQHEEYVHEVFVATKAKLENVKSKGKQQTSIA